MHELSIAMGIVEIADKEALKAGVSKFNGIELVIGELSGVELASFDFAWQQAIKGTVLDASKLEIIRPPGMGKCLDCGCDFPMQQIYDICPSCHSYFKDITSGKELRVKSLLLD